ncbi:uncharacterized protein V1510DRAFT_392046, partial [Dipodascopsis tothii]|uniref:uncharacterized protein n=1 Tax=Dipodascopsis tothii TaxID=44089 RepID=UPI0034CDE06E
MAGGTGSETATARPFFRRNRKNRPCDGCRRRKTRCIRASPTAVCTVCVSHGERCTYMQEPPARKISAKTADGRGGSAGSATGSATGGSVDGGADDRDDDYALEPMVPADVGEYGPGSLCADPGAYSAVVADDLGMLFPHVAEFDILPMSDDRWLRRVSPATTFMMKRETEIGRRQDRDLHAHLAGLVGDKSAALLDLYFSVVHPSYPVLLKSVFWARHLATPTQVAPDLLAAMYAVAVDWRDRTSTPPETDPLQKAAAVAGSGTPPADSDVDELALKLARVAYVSFQQRLARARISTVQAGLLLLQITARFMYDGSAIKTEIGFTDEALIAQILALAERLGLNLDCSDWPIEAWEKHMRKRVGWGLYVYDRFVSACASSFKQKYLIDDRIFRLRDLERDNFCTDLVANGGAQLFIETTRLVRVVSDIIATRRALRWARESGVIPFAELAKQVDGHHARLQSLYNGLPEFLMLMRPQPTAGGRRPFTASGYLHLLFRIADISLHQISLSMAVASGAGVDPRLADACVTTITAALDFFAFLTPEYLEAFWPRNCSDMVAELGIFISQVETCIVNDNLRQDCRRYRATLRARLKKQSRMSRVFAQALYKLENIVWRIADSAQSLLRSPAPADAALLP